MAAHRYWRIYWTATDAGPGYIGVAEIQMRTAIGGSNVLAGGTASASSEFPGPYQAFQALDANPATFWSGNGPTPHWWKYDLGAGNAKDIIEYVLTARNDSNYTQTGRDFQLQASDDNSTWTTIDTRAGVAWTIGQTRVFNWARPVVTADCNNPPDGQAYEPYTHQFLATGGRTPIVWTIAGGSLPPGLTLDMGTGVVSGIPTTPGLYSFTIRACDTPPIIQYAILNVTWEQIGAVAGPYHTSLISSNGIINFSGLHNENAATFAKQTVSIDVLHGDQVVFGNPALKFDVNAPNLAYPVEIWQAWGASYDPIGTLELKVYDLWMDVSREDGATGTLRPTSAQFLYGNGIAPGDPYNYGLNAGGAADTDPGTYATVYRSQLNGIHYPILEVGTAGWVDGNNPPVCASVVCSIRIAGTIASWLDLWVWRELFRFVSLTQQISFPSGYERALKLQLAAEFGRQYPGQDLSRIKKQLADALGHIDQENLSNSMAIEEIPPPETV